MVTVSVKSLVEAIREADAYALPEMDDGVGYLYDAVYGRMAVGHKVRLSKLDFDAFDTEDIDTFGDLYSDVFEKNLHTADNITSTLREVSPVCKVVGYL